MQFESEATNARSTPVRANVCIKVTMLTARIGSRNLTQLCAKASRSFCPPFFENRNACFADEYGLFWSMEHFHRKSAVEVIFCFMDSGTIDDHLAIGAKEILSVEKWNKIFYGVV